MGRAWGTSEDGASIDFDCDKLTIACLVCFALVETGCAVRAIVYHLAITAIFVYEGDIGQWG